MALEGWSLVLKGLLKLERKKPPGRLSLSDFSRLVQSREKAHNLLYSLGWAAVDESSLLSRKCLAGKLHEVTQQAANVRDFEVMVHENLQLFSDPVMVSQKVGLELDWREIACCQFRELDEEIREAVRQAFPQGRGGAK